MSFLLHVAQASDAFVNDAVMSAELDRIIGATRAQRVELAAGVEALRTKLPHNVGFDEQGRVFLKAQGDGSSGTPAAASVTSSGHPLRTPRRGQVKGQPPAGVNDGFGGQSWGRAEKVEGGSGRSLGFS